MAKIKNFNKILNLFVSIEFIKKPHIRNRIIAILGLLLIDLSATTLITYNYKLIITALSSQGLSSIWLNIWLLGLCLIISKTIIHVQEIIFFPVVNAAIKEVTYRVIAHIHTISLLDYNTLSIQETISSIRRISVSARSFIKTLILTIIPTTIKLIITLIVAIHMGLYGILLIPVMLSAIIILYYGTKWYIAARKNAWDSTDRVVARINDSIINTKTIRNFLSIEMHQLMELLNNEAKCWNQTNTRLHWIYIGVFLILGSGITLILSGVIISIKQSKLVIGDFVFLKAQLISAFIPFKGFMLEFRQIAESLADIKKIINILEIPAVSPRNIYVNFDKNLATNMVYLDRVSFGYIKAHPIIQNFSLAIAPEEKIIITGKNGSGKSTLINLIAGLYTPSQGKVFIRGQNIQTISPQELTSKVYCVQQDFKLFNRSLWYNLTYGIENLSRENIEKMLYSLKFMHFLQHLPHQLDTTVGEMGANLSAGEKQKIGIFRALMLKPDLLILDETTNAINCEHEEEILNVISSYISTFILVSHRHNHLINFKFREINMDQLKFKLEHSQNIIA